MTIWGWDASHYDAVPAGSRVVSEGIAFMTHKAGGDANDAEIGSWWAALEPVRDQVLLGAYWVLLPGDGAAAADRFLARLDATCPGWRDGPFILQLDCEKWSSVDNPSKATIKACCDRLRVKASKLMPIVYAPEWTYGNTLQGLGYPLWASHYVAGSGYASELYPGDGSSLWGPYSGQNPAVLQFTSSATIAGQTTCDANAYRGTLAQLTALLAPGWDIDMPLTDADATLVATKVLQIDGLIDNIDTAGDDATNPDISLATGIHRIYDLAQRTLAAVQALADPEAVAAAVVAALPPAAAGGLTAEQLRAAAAAGVADAFRAAFPPAA